ncbi:MAG: ABC transporter substrate-binding protein [Deltaproteobacteria bacterium]|jgi:branched-chain amino acid transport system substrate-binding protein|nr:ABC transporter substrate-binding protein [Deltaproteobacteria bacterium]
MHSRLPLFFFVAVLLFSTSCVTLGGLTGSSSDRSPGQVLTDADAAYRTGDYSLAARLYRQYLGAVPDSPRREALLGSAALSAERSGDFAGAAESYGLLIRDYPGGQFAKEAGDRLGAVYLADNKPKEALAAAQSGLARAGGAGAATARQRLVEGKALFMLGRRPEAVASFVAAQTGADAKTRDEAKNGLYATFATLSQEELGALTRQYGQNFPGPEAVWFMARKSWQAKDQATFEAQRQYFKTYFPSHPWGARLADLAAGNADFAVPGADFNPRAHEALVTSSQSRGTQTAASRNYGSIPSGLTVAAVLPLTKDANARISLELLQGLRVALAKSGGRPTLKEFDTKGVPAAVRRNIGELAEDETVIALIGPTGSPEALAAATTAQEVGIPMLGVSQRIGLNADRSYVFRLYLTHELQAKAVAAYAIRENGHENLAILYPADAYGELMRRAFASEVARLGGNLVVSESYDFASGNYKEVVSRVTGGAKPVRRASTSYQAPTGYTAVFLPDDPFNVAQIVAEMAFHDVTRMQYLGTSAWYNKDLLTNAGRYLQGAIIPMPVSSMSKRPEAVAFREAYRELYGKEPGLAAYYGHDAGIALLSALASGATTRQGLARALRSQKAYPGAAGPFSFDNEGEYSLNPVFLTIRNNEFILLKEAGESRF